MAYNKTTWHKGDVVSSSGLNNMEDGIAANDAAISEIHDPAKSAIADGGMGYYTNKTTLEDQTIPVADWHSDNGVYAEISLTGIEFSDDNIYWIVIDGVATKCVYDFDIISPDGTPDTHPLLSIPHEYPEDTWLVLSESGDPPEADVSFQLISADGIHMISNDLIQPSGFDGVIIKGSYGWELKSGDYADVVKKIDNGIPVRFLVGDYSNPTSRVITVVENAYLDKYVPEGDPWIIRLLVLYYGTPVHTLNLSWKSGNNIEQV